MNNVNSDDKFVKLVRAISRKFGLVNLFRHFFRTLTKKIELIASTSKLHLLCVVANTCVQ